jgi:hypothetical protein
MKQAETPSVSPSIPNPAGTLPPEVAPQALANHVCPFCGTLAINADDLCTRCGMQNTPVTRKATIDRMGPWFVLQSRNPAAPGMKFNTLKALAAKGRIRSRSVVRGPTTDQLWTFASQVRGLSRELGICWTCSAEIPKTSVSCPHCAALQEVPANPDVLLESAAATPIVEPFRKISVFEAELLDANSAIDLDSMGPRPAPPPRRPLPSPSSPVELSSTTTSPRSTGTPSRQAGSVNPGKSASQPTALASHDVPIPSQNAPLDEAQFASAFVQNPQPGPRKRGRMGRVLGVFFLLILAAGGVIASQPGWRTQALAIMDRTWRELQKDWSDAVGGVRQNTSNPNAANPTASKPNTVNPNTAAPSSSAPDVSTPAKDDNNKPAANPTTTPTITTDSANPAAAKLKPEDSKFWHSDPAQPHPTPAGQSNPVPDQTQPKVPILLPATQPGADAGDDALDKEAWNLYGQAFDAMNQRKYSLAVELYEQIERMASSHWPTDIAIRLQEARTKMAIAHGAN